MSEIKKAKLTSDGEIILYETDGTIHNLSIDDNDVIKWETTFTQSKKEDDANDKQNSKDKNSKDPDEGKTDREKRRLGFKRK